MLAAIHYLHLVAGVAWAGGTFAVALVLYPALPRMAQPEAQALWSRLAPPLGTYFGVASGLTLLLGILRAWLGGGITSFPDLLTPYGLWVLAALVLAVLDGALGGALRKRLEQALSDPALHAARTPGLARTLTLGSCAMMAALIGVMVVLGLGLY